MDRQGRPGVIYFHPYEFDPEEMGHYRHLVSLKTRLHQGIGRKSFPRKIRKLTGDFLLGPFREVLADLIGTAGGAKGA
jgi:hypothetical protein